MPDRLPVWESMTSRERIVAMSLVAGGVVAIVNSTVWAVVVAFMSAQRARVKVAEAHAYAHHRLPMPRSLWPLDDDEDDEDEDDDEDGGDAR